MIISMGIGEFVFCVFCGVVVGTLLARWIDKRFQKKGK